MELSTLDWLVIAAYGLVALGIGLRYARKAGQGTDEFFLSGRKLPWWMLGTSMVATTFSTDTPNLVTNLVRRGGVAENWAWWAFLITGMCTTIFYAKLWRRSEALTDVEFYELRYSGKPAAFLRGFRAVYLGLFFNIMIIGTVTLAATKISGVLLGISPLTTVLVAGSVTVLYSASSGLSGVVITDMILFVIAMVGSVAAAVFALNRPEVGGLSALVNNPDIQPYLGLLPDCSDVGAAAAVFIIPVAVQWWSAWSPGAEPGGGGYIAQRMLAAKNEKEAMKATLWFNIAHYGLRPWPWILVALCSLLVYPELSDIAARFPNLDPSLLGDDLAYPAMLTFLPTGLLGLVVASILAAYISTMSTMLNLGASYVVNDVYGRFVNKQASEKRKVRVGQLVTVVLMIGAALLALQLESATQAFRLLLAVGAGTGLLFFLRWFWPRINAWSEISAMVLSLLVAFGFEYLGPENMQIWHKFALSVGVTTLGWMVVTLLTPPTDAVTLQKFQERAKITEGVNIQAGLIAALTASLAVYGLMFATGSVLYGQALPALGFGLVSLISGFICIRTYRGTL
ncbi:MAG: Na+:solute symporter [Candidatus Hydrogenedentes bacterium]|nr:Na+:solute symporter [Candidatus Hydrogenedentota bacterium]